MRPTPIICAAVLLLLFVAIRCTKKEPEIETPLLTVTCPRDTTILAGEDYYAHYKAPDPVVFTNCKAGGLKITTLSGGVENAFFPIGTTVMAYQVTDACGNSASCSYRITVQKNGPLSYCSGIEGVANFRKVLVGLYAGQASIGSNPSYPTTLPICYDPNTLDHVLVSNDQVLLDSLCNCFPAPTFGNYRTYELQFSGDSIFFHAQLNGPASDPEPVFTFRGKKVQ